MEEKILDNSNDNLNPASNPAILSPDSPAPSSELSPATQKPPKKKLLLFGSIGLGVILIGVVVFLIVSSLNRSGSDSGEAPVLSPDGLTETEIAELGLPTDENNKIITEYNLFDDSALSLIKQDDFFAQLSSDSDRNEITDDYIKETLYNFFSEVYPDYASIIFLPNSLSGNSFKLRSNTGAEYTVNLSFASEDDEVPTISVLSAEGNEIFNYNGQYYLGDAIVLTEEEADAFFGDAEPADEGE